MDAGIIHPFVSPYASLITTAPKEDGILWLCTGYREINNQTHLAPFDTPRIDRIIDDTDGCSWFSRIYLCKGFWPVPSQEDTKKCTAFVTPFDIYEYNRLPTGCKNSARRFQKMLNIVLDPFIGRFCDVCVEYVTVYSKSERLHNTWHKSSQLC